MPWICGKHGICPDSDRECEECEHFSENNNIHWTDDKDTLLVVKELQLEIERLKDEVAMFEADADPLG